MKTRLFGFIAILGILLFSGVCYAFPNTLTILSNKNIGEGNGTGGVSYFVVDLSAYPGTEMYSFQWSSVTETYARPSSGASIEVSVATTNSRPAITDNDINKVVSGVSVPGAYAWIPVISDMDVYSGNTIGQYPFIPEAGKYLIGKVENTGTADITGTLLLGFHKGTGWLSPIPMPISTTYSMFGLETGITIYPNIYSGVSTSAKNGYDAALIPPTGANWVKITPKGDDTVWTFDMNPLSGVSGPWTRPSLTAGEVYAVNTSHVIPVEKYIRSVWITTGVTNGCIALDWTVDEPRD